jgi:hypothetical protein
MMHRVLVKIKRRVAFVRELMRGNKSEGWKGELKVRGRDTTSWWIAVFSGARGQSLACKVKHTSQAALKHRLDQYPEKVNQPIRSPRPIACSTEERK